MTRAWFPAVALGLLAVGAGPAPPARADIGPLLLADSTTFHAFTLPNGLRVTARHVPGCRNVDVTVAFDYGSGDEPPGKEGLSSLLAELQFYGATAETPERTRKEMPGLRPAGWDVTVSQRVTRLSEIAPAQLLPGLIHQAADRLRGVTVTPSALRRAVGAVRADLDTAWRLNVGSMLDHAARSWAEGEGEAKLARMTAARGLQSLGVKEVQQRLASVFVPANAVLAVAGNLGQIQLRALVESEFGSIPGGEPTRRAQAAGLDSATHRVRRADLSRALGVIGVIAPALEDSLHPAFFLKMVFVGAHCTRLWGRAETPLPPRFHYSIYDDPDLARFFPPMAPEATDPAFLSEVLTGTLEELNTQIVTPMTYRSLWRGLDWLLGGPLPTGIYDRVLVEPGALHTLCTGAAVRELWGGEPFWSRYRERFDRAVDNPYTGWFEKMFAPRLIVSLLFVPSK